MATRRLDKHDTGITRFMANIMRGIKSAAEAPGPVHRNINPADVYGHKSKTFKGNKRRGK